MTAHEPVPEQPEPDQPANVEPDVGLAVSVTFVALAKPAEQIVPQLIPVGLEVTMPEPGPASDTVSACPSRGVTAPDVEDGGPGPNALLAVTVKV